MDNVEIQQTPRALEAVEAAKSMFWSTIASSFPEVTTGDLSPEMDLVLSSAMQVAVQEWLWANYPEQQSPA